MKLEQIITLGNRAVRLPLLAMIRSLRATGCALPVRVVPYDDDVFDLPAGCTWWRDEAVLTWLGEVGAHPMMRKYQCLLEARYQFVDSDVIFLRDPAAALAEVDGFVVCCGHWRDASHTTTPVSRAAFERMTTNWPAQVFNAGQFACDRPLYPDLAALRAVAEDPAHAETCLHHASHDQPGLNLLRLLSGVPLTNLTLPPHSLESSWAQDYARLGRLPATDGPAAPYLLHWAGAGAAHTGPVAELFATHFDAAERRTWDAFCAAEIRSRRDRNSLPHRLRTALRAARQALRNPAA